MSTTTIVVASQLNVPSDSGASVGTTQAATSRSSMRSTICQAPSRPAVAVNGRRPLLDVPERRASGDAARAGPGNRVGVARGQALVPGRAAQLGADRRAAVA